MADRVVMRFSPDGMARHEKLHVHAETCPTCKPLMKDPRQFFSAINRFGCLTGVLLSEEFRQEYERLHSKDEKRRHDRMKPEEVDALVNGIRGTGRG